MTVGAMQSTPRVRTCDEACLVSPCCHLRPALNVFSHSSARQHSVLTSKRMPRNPAMYTRSYMTGLTVCSTSLKRCGQSDRGDHSRWCPDHTASAAQHCRKRDPSGHQQPGGGQLAVRGRLRCDVHLVVGTNTAIHCDHLTTVSARYQLLCYEDRPENWFVVGAACRCSGGPFAPFIPEGFYINFDEYLLNNLSMINALKDDG